MTVETVDGKTYTVYAETNMGSIKDTTIAGEAKMMMIASQNQMIAQGQNKAQAAFSVANGLGLVQSYASADASYFYQDGVFYSQAADGQYYVIVPPAGALVESLPEDYEKVILNGNEYFKVDDTVYQMVINEGKPFFEVLGQMN